VFGVSFPEFLLLGTVALLVLGPEKLPGMLRTMGQWGNGSQSSGS
jgi:sec-independent protein translocase protein TatB